MAQTQLLARASLATLLICVLAACQPGTLPPEKAREAPVAFEQTPIITPPPRKIDDIEAMLEDAAKPSMRRTDKQLDLVYSEPPPTGHPGQLARYYLRRAAAWGGLGRPAQRLKDLQTAQRYFNRIPEQSLRQQFLLRREIARMEFALGSYRKAIQQLRDLIATRPAPVVYADLIRALIRTGQLDEATRVQEQAVNRIDQIQSRALDRLTAQRRDMFRRQRARIMVMVLQSQGRFKEAEQHIRVLLAPAPQAMEKDRKREIGERIAMLLVLVKNLLRQGRVTEAELAAREAVETSLRFRGLNHPKTAVTLTNLSQVMRIAGRLKDAERLLVRALGIFNSSKLSGDSTLVSTARFGLGGVHASMGDWKAALADFRTVRVGLKQNRDFFDTLAARNLALPLTLIKTDQATAAVEMLRSQIAREVDIYGEGHHITAARRGALAMALARLGNRREALEAYRQAVPVLIRARRGPTAEDSAINAWGVDVILESYIDFLTRLKLQDSHTSLDEDAVFEALGISDVMRARAVDRALGANIVRAAAGNDELGDLIRRQQDLERYVAALYAALANSISLPQSERDPATVASLKQKIANATQARKTINETISSRYPRFHELAGPQTFQLETLKMSLKPTEAVIATYVTDAKTYVWAVSPGRPVGFAVASVGRQSLERIVTALRASVDSDARTLGDIPPFDIKESHRLFNLLLRPVAASWQRANSLLVVADGPLGQIPFHLLVTKEAPLGKDDKALFSKYRRVSWLARSHAIAAIPSIAAIVALRRLPERRADRRPFFGVGDPVFNYRQAAQAAAGGGAQLASAATTRGGLRLRGARGDIRGLPTATLERLPRLPDTGEELMTIAKLLKADLGRDVLLGAKATEQAVRTRDLTPYRILSFATHGLVPGDLDGLTEPALALSSPKVTKTKGDGVLTMSEILSLRFNADWILLSACNTGAAGSAGAEAFSGLGRAFFYAGARALLLSNWPVHSASTAELMRHIFSRQDRNRSLSRSRALQRAMIDLIDGPGFIDIKSGKVLFSYAHPLFWAPFIVLGDGAGANRSG